MSDKQETCAKRRCRRQPTQAFDVFSWFVEQRKQTPAHYEVCDKHADYFTGSFDVDASKRVKADLEPWRGPHVHPGGDGTMSDKAEAALADWLMRRCGLEISPLSIREGAEQIVAAEFDALLADLPEEAVSAMEDAYLASDEPFDAAEEFRIAARAFLRSLRGDGA